MLHIAVTGPTNLPRLAAAMVFRSLVSVLRWTSGARFRGITCLADGVDQIFAEAVLAVGGTYEVILPAWDYRSRAIRPENVGRFDRLMNRAAAVHEIPCPESNEEAFASANVEMINRSHRLIAVWDGRPSLRRGGAAHAVATAERAGIEVVRIWPAERDVSLNAG
jgi:hypothetical protein